MSADATAYVFRHSPFTGGTFACHLAIGDTVSDQHENRFWMSQAKLADKARVSRATAKRAVDELEEDGWIAQVDPATRGGAEGGHPAVFVFLFETDVEVIYEARGRPRGVTMHPRTEGSPAGTEGSPDPQPRGHHDPLTQEEPNEPNQAALLPDDQPPATAKKRRDPKTADADAVTREWWNSLAHKPLQTNAFLAIRGIVKKALADWPRDKVLAALHAIEDDPPVTGWKLDKALREQPDVRFGAWVKNGRQQ